VQVFRTGSSSRRSLKPPPVYFDPLVYPTATIPADNHSPHYRRFTRSRYNERRILHHVLSFIVTSKYCIYANLHINHFPTPVHHSTLRTTVNNLPRYRTREPKPDLTWPDLTLPWPDMSWHGLTWSHSTGPDLTFSWTNQTLTCLYLVFACSKLTWPNLIWRWPDMICPCPDLFRPDVTWSDLT